MDQEIQKLNRALNAFPRITQALRCATQETEFLEQVCGVLVYNCGYVMAWIGFAEDDEAKTVRPVAHAGFEDGRLQSCVSSISIPLVDKGRPFGAISVSSEEPDAFSPDEVKLLTELADYLAYGIHTLRLRRAHELAEEALKEREQQLLGLLNAIPTMAWTSHPVGGFDFLNEQAYQYTGLTVEHFREELGFIRPVHPADVETVLQERKNALREGRQFEFECRIRRASDGSYRWHLVRGIPVRREGGEILRWLGTCTDIDDLKQAQDRAAEQETLFRTLFATVPLSAALIDLESQRFIRFNDAAARNLGYSREEFAKLTVADIEAVLSREEIRKITDEHNLLGESAVLESKHRTKDGRLRDVVIYYHLLTLGGRRVINCVWQDVTEEKAAEAALVASERRANERETWFRTLFNSLPMSAILFDPFTRKFLQFNDAAARNLGYTREEFAQLKLDDIDAGFSPEMLAQHIEERLREHSLKVFEVKHRTKSGEIQDVMVHGDVLAINGQPVFSSVWYDVTGEKAAEAALVASERRANERETWFRSLFNSLPISAVLIDPLSLRFLQFNNAAAKNLGYTREEFARLKLSDIDVGLSMNEMTAMAAEHLRAPTLRVIETKHRTKDGAIREVLVHTEILTINGQPVSIGVWYDVTEKKAAEAALIRSEKLASAGRLAATVAHEINNPLAAVTNCVYLVRSDPKLPPDLKEHLEIAERELGRVAHIAKRTLGFYRERAKPVPLEVRSLIEEVVEIYHPQFERRNIRLKVEQKSGPRAIVAIAGEIRQVISNLLSNAIDAARGGGTVTIRTSQVSLSDGCYVRITIADTGSGISALHLHRIFEPFFTTKKEVGTGLGLWVSREIIRKHKGRIRVRSIEGKGAVFSVFLPA